MKKKAEEFLKNISQEFQIELEKWQHDQIMWGVGYLKIDSQGIKAIDPRTVCINEDIK